MAVAERNQDATIYVGGLDEKVSEALLWELFVQAGPVVNVHMPKDRITQNHQGYGFIEFMSEEDADYAIKIMNMIKLYGKPIRVNKASAHQKNRDIGANLFIGNLDPEVDEKLIYDTFSAFGIILQVPKIMRDNDTGGSKGYAFINFASFEASDAALEAMNGQYLCNRPITISYAFKKDSKGERHGSEAERFLAAQNPLPQAERPHQLFADAPPTLGNGVPPQAPPPQQMSMTSGMSPFGMPPGMGGPPPPGAFGMPPGGHFPPMAQFNPMNSMGFPMPPMGHHFGAMGFPPMPPMGQMGQMAFNPAMMRAPQPPPPPPMPGMMAAYHQVGAVPPPPPPPPPMVPPPPPTN